MRLKIILSWLVIIFGILSLASAQNIDSTEVKLTDLLILKGQWVGTLTYMDYSSNQPFSLPCNLEILPGKNENQLRLFLSYPNEPKANSKEKISLSKNGIFLNKVPVKSKLKLPSGDSQIITQYSGRDGNDRRKALIRTTYQFKVNSFVIRKEVKYADEEWLMRSEYKFDRVKAK